MRVGIMQPYFLPYMGYFQLIKCVDRFIFFDDVQYIRHGWINRNRVLKPGEGWQYIIAPLQKHQQVELIKNIKVTEGMEWKQKILRQLEHYKKRAPYYDESIDLLKTCFDAEVYGIAEFNSVCINVICQYLDIPFKVEMSSQMNFDYSNVNDPGEWALRISEQLGAKEYINPPGGVGLFDKEKFEGSDIQLTFLSPILQPYDQRRGTFEPGLSIIDVLMFNGLDTTKQLINKFELKASE